jgi:UDP-4-amino-4,6-dideoxy-N-acetyl-beta-L-altrosamine transaminase
MIPYGRQTIDETDIDEVVKALKGAWITQGPSIEKFERHLAEYCGCKYAVAVSSGTSALHLACLAAGLRRGDEAITTPITFVGTANAIIYTGAKPVFADIDYNTVNINTNQIKKKIGKKTKAILPVHFAGLPCDMQEIANIAKKSRLIIIEDACHALGSEYKHGSKWVKVGSCMHSDMAVFSFHPVKSITTGEGGAVLTNRRDLYKKLLMLRHHGITKNSSQFSNRNSHSKGPWYYEMLDLGFNYRITDFQSALGISQLRKLDKFVERRREIVSIYSKELSGDDKLIMSEKPSHVKSSCHIYYIRIKDISNRKKIFNKLLKAGIGVQVHYIPVHLQPYYKENFKCREGSNPYAEQYYRETITLPLFPDMTDTEVKRVIKVLKKIL